MSCVDLYKLLGVQNVVMCDLHGVVYKGRKEMNKTMERHAVDTVFRSLKEIVKGADVFLGCSAGNLLTPEMLLSMADTPIVFAMANPTPEID